MTCQVFFNLKPKFILKSTNNQQFNTYQYAWNVSISPATSIFRNRTVGFWLTKIFENYTEINRIKFGFGLVIAKKAIHMVEVIMIKGIFNEVSKYGSQNVKNRPKKGISSLTKLTTNA